ncbi:MAG: ABC transporter permease [Planctomycetota bacterium]
MNSPVTIIEAGRHGIAAQLREFWRYRELLGFLAWRDLRVRYRQTVIGAAWALIEPLVSVVVFTLLFHKVAGFDSGHIPYPLYCYAAVLLWNFFGRALRESTTSYVSNAALVRKTFFPRLVLPCACVLAVLVDLLCAMVMYVVLMLYYGLAPGWSILTMPLWIVLAGMSALGVGLVLSVINARLRDIGQALPFLVQTWMLLTPVAYPLKDIPAYWQSFYQLNPLVGAVEGMRWALLPGQTLDPMLPLISLVGGMCLLVAGVVVCSRTTRGLADVV